MPGDKLSLFAQSVYDALVEIPRGKVVTYRELARHLGCRSAQAVGQALKRNPWAPRVPCHRVVRVDGSLGGYQGATEGKPLQRKRRLLVEEEVEFLADGRVDLRCAGWEWPVTGSSAAGEFNDP
ncbi:methylated-DNA-[protein]-cysteine S-methyltransferase [Haloferula luteola]|uniref:Methylated-DNA-[protein]-cysteine S-methyltransferase n=1 Tax=Haloferula luteola TaxID=595692 RepID=A0A840V6T5_9BACT|nr:MGMT family protein [Haloferula luteola]MBB5353735.1 methylated-DNA-[protein]-cysteine S-methyltransferase [Haloferula luteola]